MQLDRRLAARPHLVRAFLGLVVAVAGVVTAGVYEITKGGGLTFDDKLGILGVALFVLGGVIIVRSVARAIHAAAADRLQGKTKGTPISFLVNAIGYLLIVLGALSMTPIKLGSLLFGGALTGVMIGIAAQQTLGNFFAGIVLLLVRPFSVADRVFLKGSLGEYEGTVTDMTLFYVHLVTERGPVVLPNAGVLASAIGPGARPKQDEKAAEDDQEQEAPGPHAGGAPGG